MSDVQSLKDFLSGKISVEDDLNSDFVHGFASAAVWRSIEQGMSPLEAGRAQVMLERLLEAVIIEVRAERG